jgi:hypothetical protein
MILQILQHTPVWVWALLLALLALGFAQTRPRRVPRGRLLLLPLSLLALGLWTMAPNFVAQPLTLLVWLCTLGAFTFVGMRLRPPAGALWQAEAARLQLPGSWFPLALIVTIFGLRYTMGVSLALHPDWRSAPAVLLPAAAAFGALSGLFLGRSLRLRALTA